MSTVITVPLNRLPQIAGQLDGRVADVINEAAFAVVAAARPPVDTGALQTNTTVETAGPGRHEASVTWNQDYAGYQEFGTARTPPQPFAGPAADVVSPQFVALMQQAVGG